MILITALLTHDHEKVALRIVAVDKLIICCAAPQAGGELVLGHLGRRIIFLQAPIKHKVTTLKYTF